MSVINSSKMYSCLKLCCLLVLIFSVSPTTTSNTSKESSMKPPKTTTEMPPTTSSTTTSGTTTSSSTTSTTAAPTTTPTTAAPVTTTVAPTPLPPPEIGLWSYTEGNKTCVIVQMAAQLNVTYENADSVSMYSAFDMPVNNTIVSNGSCGNNSQSITLTWAAVGQLNNSLTLSFAKNTTTDKFALVKMEFDIVQDEKHFPKTKDVNSTIYLIHRGDSFTTPLTMSYLCSKSQDIILENEGNANSTVVLKNVQMQAFHTDKGHAFGNANDCSYVDVPDIVPIAVGCALGALVLIVFIAYIIGRHRQTQGYLSM